MIILMTLAYGIGFLYSVDAYLGTMKLACGLYALVMFINVFVATVRRGSTSLGSYWIMILGLGLWIAADSLFVY